MTQRRRAAGDEDAIATEGESSQVPQPVRPPRPVAVLVASAFLVVNGLVSTVLSISVAGELGDQVPGIAPLAAVSIALGLATTILGVLLHFGRGWLVTLNVAAVAGFLELTSGLPAGWISGGLDVAVVIVLLWHRPWFAWSPSTADGRDEGEAGGAPEEDGGAA